MPDALEFEQPLLELGQSVAWSDYATARGGVSYFSPGQPADWWPQVAQSEGQLQFCGEHTDAWQGTIDGAVRSGQRAAAEILARRGLTLSGPASVSRGSV